MCNLVTILWFSAIIMVQGKHDEVVLLNETIDRLSKALDYVKNVSHEYILLDVILGVRVIDDQLELILESNKSLRSEDFRVFIPRICELQKKAEDIANDFIPILIECHPQHVRGAQDWATNGRWKLDHPDTVTDESLIDEESEYEEPKTFAMISGYCTSQVTGEWGKPCSCVITEDCWTNLTSPGHTDYWITHQMLYLETVEMCGCDSKIEELTEKFNQTSLQHLYNVFCSNILKESELIAKKDFPEPWQDLFAEQVVVCGLISFRDFYRPEWLEAMLSWQRPNYCFGTDNINYFKDLQLALEQGRTELMLEDNCLLHKTSVTIGALAVCIRLLMTESIS